ncbi:hypothetical protein [Iningainema tapete]|uniref:Uncharacterized protein n=1 Tax=Iningainema tapete BLCC-T55 TaxID=2748662 RepID=A0A8J6XUM2_9CYAN|nr:hypothetical protein [Iningainema tapete]MBD2778615.1 hypothetical protein [Iningainema tapete BLCC-T55]
MISANTKQNTVLFQELCIEQTACISGGGGFALANAFAEGQGSGAIFVFTNAITRVVEENGNSRSLSSSRSFVAAGNS